MLKEAHERWAARRAVRDGPLASSRSRGSLLAALRDNPGRFRDKPFMVSIYEHDGLSPEAERGVKEAKAEYEDTGGRATLDAYEGWRAPAGTYVLDFHWNLGRRTASLDGFWKIVSDRPYRRLKGTSITLCTRVPSFEGLSAVKETTALAQAATKVMLAHGNAELTVTAEEFGHRLTAIR
jgi:hypothetical protein